MGELLNPPWAGPWNSLLCLPVVGNCLLVLDLVVAIALAPCGYLTLYDDTVSVG
jgi:hypothetical protein